MMKSFKIFMVGVILSMVITSCSDDFFDIAPSDELNTETFFRSSEDVEQAVAALYGAYAQNGQMERYLLIGRNIWSDDAWGTSWSGTQYSPVGDGSYTPSFGFAGDVWGYFYKVIRRTNVILANIDQAEMDEGLREDLRAETRFVRAWFYNELTTNWGDVPFIRTPLTAEESKVMTRTPKSDIVSFIISELEAVATELPVEPRLSGTVTRGAANALLARVNLFEGNYAAAETAAEAVMAGGYGLLSNYSDVFKKANENSQEVIFDVQYSNDGWSAGPIFAAQQVYVNPPGTGGWTAVSPSQSIVDEYETSDGLTISDPANVLYDPANPYANRDPRLDASIVTPGETLVHFNGSSQVIDPWDDGSSNRIGGGNSTTTGYWTQKFIDNTVNPGNVEAVNYILMRYPEVLLTYAEAKIEDGTIDQSVVDAINDIRARAYGTTRADVANYPEITTLDQTELRSIVRRERRIELAFEGKRWYDIKRWRIAETVMPADLMGAIDPATGTNVTASSGRVFDPAKHYLWPIPESEIAATEGALKQNPNW